MYFDASGSALLVPFSRVPRHQKVIAASRWRGIVAEADSDWPEMQNPSNGLFLLVDIFFPLEFPFYCPCSKTTTSTFKPHAQIVAEGEQKTFFTVQDPVPVVRDVSLSVLSHEHDSQARIKFE